MATDKPFSSMSNRYRIFDLLEGVTFNLCFCYAYVKSVISQIRRRWSTTPSALELISFSRTNPLPRLGAGSAFGVFNSTVSKDVGLGAQRQIQLSTFQLLGQENTGHPIPFTSGLDLYTRLSARFFGGVLRLESTRSSRVRAKNEKIVGSRLG